MPARFLNPVLLSNGDLKVRGPFSTSDGQVLGDVLIRFLIIPDREEGQPPRETIDRVTTVPPGGNAFEEIVPAAEVPELREGDRVRGIALAVAVKHFPPGPSAPPAPPSFETLTWCVKLRIEIRDAA